MVHRIVREKTKETIKKGKEAKEESERRIKRCKAKACKHQRGGRRVRKEENKTKQKEEE